MTTTMMMSGKTSDSVTHRRNNSNSSVFREAQTDLLHPFQGHHFDLLGGNPPSHNPDFVSSSQQGQHSNPPPQNPDFIPSSQRANLPLTCSELSRMAGSFSASPSVRRVSNNPFEDSSNPFEASSSSQHEMAPRATVVVHENQASVPVASVVAISEDEEEDSSIPLVSAMRIDENEERQRDAPTSSTTTSTTSWLHVSSPGPAVRAARRQQQEQDQRRRERPPPLVFHSRSNQDPEWLGRRQSAPTTASSRRNSASTTTALRKHSYTNWSRISTQTKATVREAKRSLKKAIGREAKKLKKTIGKETKVLRRAIREDMDRMAAGRRR